MVDPRSTSISRALSPKSTDSASASACQCGRCTRKSASKTVSRSAVAEAVLPHGKRFLWNSMSRLPKEAPGILKRKNLDPPPTDHEYKAVGRTDSLAFTFVAPSSSS
mmetsp:Transcript_28719/g.78892  ORF Transcript_28719/g.78892 Transcript_28719/m.78892 type:complete len:107 (-) Transcript_28719:1042-1362(-)